MSIEALRTQIERIDPVNQRESDSIAATLELLTTLSGPHATQRDHLTASAFVVSSRGVVLHRHRLLDMWIQPGGHIDDGESPESAALRETLEETGLRARHLDPAELFHVDVHAGPKGHRGQSGHLHYDLRYVVVAAPLDPTPAHGESPEVFWFDFETAQSRCEPALGARDRQARPVLRDVERAKLNA